MADVRELEKIVREIEKTSESIRKKHRAFETTEDSLATKIQNQLQTLEGREALRASLDPLGQKYVEAVLRGAQDKESGIDHVYGVYLHKDGLMFGKMNSFAERLNDLFYYFWKVSQALLDK
ncbi:hypothetical protein ALC57_09058 [Trachymyrmex cornetzi]|uniref:Uncharacterized protein n=1 Tax=Trachymyrmex cornetzi TaxID=471704 RepID=A0A151J626_9HYME|nr:hypothetical protein ALC57_09058 [Trachymyrmex cornetzi]